MSAQPLRDRRDRRNPCPSGHEMRLQRVELPPRQVVHRGGVGGWKLSAGYSQWICDTCGHRGIPLPVSR